MAIAKLLNNEITTSFTSFIPRNDTSCKCAFTLAEVLITLGIIGIVAALTMPALIANHKEKQTVTALKRSYSLLSQAFTQITVAKGEPNTWNLQSVDEFKDLFKSYLKVTNDCAENSGKCNPPTYFLHNVSANITFDYNNKDAHSSFITADGVLYTFWLNPYYYAPNCDEVATPSYPDSCALTIHVDVNGHKRPNTWGKDRFQFRVFNSRITPAGLKDNGGDSFEDYCVSGVSGLGCAGWVIANENMDYLKCDDLSWDGKTKCD